MKNYTKLIPKIALTGLLIVFTSVQLIHAQGIRGGIKAGLNLSYLSIEDANDNNIVPGFHAGLWGEFLLTDNFSLQPELLFSTKGVKATYDSDFLGFDIADGETKLNLSYIDIPVYLKFNLAEDFNFHFGPYLGFLLNSSYDTQNEILEFINVDNSDDIDTDQFNSLDYGIAGGLGFALEPLIFGFNYSLGLRPVAKDEEQMDILLGDSKNNTIQIYVGFTF